MSFLDRKLAELERYAPPDTAPEDLDAFWKETLQAVEARPLNDRREEVESLSPHIRVFRVTYEGFDDTPIHGWYLLPRFGGGELQQEALTCIVIYHGYHGSKGFPEQYASWLLMGYAVFAIDVRGQSGETGSRLPQEFGMTKGWITQGLLDPRQSYYRAAAVDAVRAVEWAARQPEVNPERIITAGESQGGGLALLTGVLSTKPALIIADIPNMCHMDYGIFHSTGSLAEAAAFVTRHPERLDEVLRTLSYFDVLNLYERLQSPVFMSVGLKDTVCVPETIYAVYNRLAVPKEMHVFPFNGHHTSGDHMRRRLAFIRQHLVN